MGLLSGPHLKETIQPAPVKHCLPALGPPETDGGDTARGRKHTRFKHRKVLTPTSKLTLQPVTTHTGTKSQNGEKRSHREGAPLGGGGGGRDGCLYSHGVFADYTKETKTAIHQIAPPVDTKHFNWSVGGWGGGLYCMQYSI